MKWNTARGIWLAREDASRTKKEDLRHMNSVVHHKILDSAFTPPSFEFPLLSSCSEASYGVELVFRVMEVRLPCLWYLVVQVNAGIVPGFMFRPTL
jgi:hypothetical protein